MTTLRRFTTHETTESVPGQEALPAAPPEPATRIAQYELIRSLGRGGMGEVHLARDLRLGRLVAVKQLNAHSTKLTEQLLTEARTTARCMHENIIVIHEVGEQDGHPYMVLEYLEGQTLRQWTRERTTAGGEHAPVPPGRAVELMLPVVRALAYAHQRGIVHRDLKPENIMLTRSGTIKVLDFGIAKHLSMRRPENDGIADGALDAMSGHVPDLVAAPSSGLIGTLPYMSPEQMKVGVIDHRSDIWTVGIMLFELVTGRHPIPTRTMEDLMRITDEDEPMPSVSLSLPDSNLGPLAGIIDRCLLKRPEHRTPSARLLLAELEALAPGRRVLVGSDGNPFTGLVAFQESDAGRFFGRNHDIEQVVTELRSRPLVAVVGPSGVGKSSLVRAGVIPALKRSSQGWDACVVRSGRSLSQHRSSMELPESSGINLVKTRKLQPRDFATTEEAAPGHGRSASSEEKSPQPVLRAGSYIGQYELIRLLGRGGMGEVHLARDLRLGRLVALRLMRTRTLHPLHTQRFLIEARATAHFPHENIVVIHEVGEYHGHPYMVLEYLEGQTLRQWMHEQAAERLHLARTPRCHPVAPWS